NMAMLLNPKTVIRNVVGNLALFAIDVPADAVGIAIDKGVSVVTGKRTRASAAVAARLGGLAQPIRDFWNGYRNARPVGPAEYSRFSSALQSLGLSEPTAEAAATRYQNFREGMKTMLTLGRLTSAGKFEVGKINESNRRTFSSGMLGTLENGLTLMLSVPD